MAENSLGYRLLIGEPPVRKRRQATYGSPVPEYDQFSQPIEDEFIDGQTRMGYWTLMAPKSHEVLGVGIGVGRGQRYRQQDDGRWLKVEG